LNRINKIVFCLIILLGGAIRIYSQEPVNVVTRRIEKEFVTQQKTRLTINAERGIIFIQSWEGNKVKVILKIIAKNKKILIAREEVQYMQYTLTQNRNEIVLKNYLLVPVKKDYAEISSIIRAEYEIFIPADMPVSIRNKFGSVTLRNLNSVLTINLEYSDLILHNSVVDMDLFINTGDLVCLNSDLQAKIETRYSHVNLSQVKGAIHLNMMYGNINISLNNDLEVDLSANRTDALLINRDCGEYDININGKYTLLRIQPDCYFRNSNLLNNSYKEDIDNSPWILNYSPPDAKSKVTIDAQFGTINLN